ncbi:MarR family winged helix-turn-helix transcriptional regulator [Nocardia donostiensis]|uniref:MarR family transcriptional regulator n=1 Tax=Nocardia donostiensis TaxID=1538463 RepID=A0A1W0BLB5_9NOCA|nr:MarR family transcriptional regulator [Nocardia donostiensis]ONM48660.1 MarR family transcriptional regulator [Nocardia donostiensis]OQS16849.1 MarR family transcriptional regulator [Nocardia donostiensis]OQS23314.1 MarR family transcriptional regulator [Nocardia donostiensis]
MNDTRWLDDDEQRLWRSYLDATRLLFQELDKQLARDAGITLADYEILVLLSEAPQRRLRMRDLADASTTSRSGITRAITRLETAGWVTRVDCETDKRGAWAELTDAGAAKLAAAGPGHVAAVRENMFDLLSPRGIAVMTHGFGEMRQHMLENREKLSRADRLQHR